MANIVLGFDDSPAARSARVWAINYARERASAIVLVYAFSSVAEWEFAAVQINTDPIRTRFGRLLAGEWSEPVRAAGVDYETKLAIGRPADKLLEVARQKSAELIVIGMTSRGVLHELVLGATARRVFHEARRPVVAVPEMW